MRLESRMRRVFTRLPSRLADLLGKRPKLFEDVSIRRNNLSDGNRDGSIRAKAHIDEFLPERTLIQTLCLAEILLLGGLDQETIAEAVCHDIEFTQYR